MDILAINGEYAVLIEAKSTLKIEDVKEHLERLEKFKGFFPEYSQREGCWRCRRNRNRGGFR